MDGSRVTELINKCRSNDVDVKIDAVSKLQSEFEAGAEIPDSDALITTLKACLRISNQHLTTATISAIPPLIPLLVTASSPRSQTHPLSNSTSSSSTTSTIDVFSLRQILLAFLSTGGIIDRLGDAREKARDKARESLIILGGYAFRCPTLSAMSSRSRDAKGPETPLSIFDRFLKESGLGSKVWRIREQSVLVLVHLRRSYHLFPIRSYLSALVGALEDTDGNVRECARQSIVEIFTGPGISDAARADLKKEMTKKGVRKSTLDSVLSKVLSGSSASTPQSEGSENGDGGKKEYIPPSLALSGRRPITSPSGSNTGTVSRTVSRTMSQSSSRELSRPSSRAATVTTAPTEMESPGSSASASATDVRPVYVVSSRDLETELAKMQKHFEGKETEHNWAPREKAIVTVRGMIKGEVHLKYQETFLAGLKQFLELSLKTLASLRTTVAVHTCLLYHELAVAIGSLLDPHCDLLLTSLLRMAALTKKLVAQQSQTTVATVIKHTSAQPRIIPHLLSVAIQDKTVQTRAYMVDHVKTYLKTHAARSKASIESSGAVETLEKCVRKALVDQNVGVRENARTTFWVFADVWKDRGTLILQGLDGVARKQLEKACPTPNTVIPATPLPPSTGKKSSVAAAIAASRAKAKAIAIDPPTLRHQATSASQAAARTMSPSKRAMSPSLSNSSTGGSVSPVLSSSPTRPRTSFTGLLSQSNSSGAGSPPRSRPSIPSFPPSAGTEDTTYTRRTSSTMIPLSSTSLHSSSPPRLDIIHSTPTPRPRTRVRSSSSNNHDIAARQSISLNEFNLGAQEDDETLLMATKIPVPDDSDSDQDDLRPVTFSTPFELYPPQTVSNVPSASFSPHPMDSKPTTMTQSFSTDSPPASTPAPIVEDAMRARAEQAESAADRLLELVEPEEDGAHEHNLLSSLLLRNGHSDDTQARNWSVRTTPSEPKTPLNKSAAVVRQAALFQDTPIHSGAKPSLLDLVKDNKHDKGWWMKRMTFVNHGTPLKGVEPADRIAELHNHISVLENGSADLYTLQKIALVCIENPVEDFSLSPLSQCLNFGVNSLPPISGSRQIQSLGADIWIDGKSFDRLFTSLVRFLDPSKEEEVLEYGLIVLWEMLENQAPYLEGRESDIFTLLLQIRYSNKLSVLEATNAIRDALTTHIEPVYGLTTMHASIRTFVVLPPPEVSNADVKAASYAFGLIALAKFILRLPGEILEEELPRLKTTLILALTDPPSLLIRESAAAVIISAQMVLRDEAHLFTLLDGLPDDKKNLLTYLFERHDARSLASDDDHSGMDKLEKEMKRLDTRTSTPPLRSVTQ